MEHHHHFEGTLHQRSSSIKVILQNRRSSSIKGHLPSKAVFHQRWSSIKGRLRSSSIKVVFPLRSSSLEGRLPSVVFFHPRSSSIKGRLSSQVVLHLRSSSIRAMYSISRHIRLFPSPTENPLLQEQTLLQGPAFWAFFFFFFFSFWLPPKWPTWAGNGAPLGYPGRRTAFPK